MIIITIYIKLRSWSGPHYPLAGCARHNGPPLSQSYFPPTATASTHQTINQQYNNSYTYNYTNNNTKN